MWGGNNIWFETTFRVVLARKKFSLSFRNFYGLFEAQRRAKIKKYRTYNAFYRVSFQHDTSPESQKSQNVPERSERVK